MNPVKPSWKSEWLPLILIIIACGLAFYFQAHFPARIPTHWDINGEVNGYSGRVFGAWLMPILMVGIYLLFLVLPYLDPKKDHYAHFVTAYHGIKNLIICFLFVLFLFVGAAGLGYEVPVGSFVPVGVGLLFIGIGYFIKNVEQNWAIGVRTPWTLESPTVWKKTNELMSRLMLLSGVLLALCAFPLEDIYKVYLFSAAIIIIVFVPIIYSYFAYQAEKKGKK
jgi:uncharacterized membrane protein